MLRYGTDMTQTSDAEVLQQLALHLLGTFTQLQESMADLARLHLNHVSPAVGMLLRPRLNRLTDKDRIAWLRAVTKDSQPSDVPLDRIETAIEQAKSVRDFIAHSPSVVPVFQEDSWQLAVAHYSEKAQVANCVGVIDAASLRKHIARSAWVSEWINWIMSDRGYVSYRTAGSPEPISYPRPPALPPTALA